MNYTPQEYALKAAGKLETFISDIRRLSDFLKTAKLWRPAAVLKSQCDETLRLINELEGRLERKLIVTLIGPCGSGKSTLLNALAEVDDLSETGKDRPTTRNLVIFCRDRNDAAPLLDAMGTSQVHIRTSKASASLEYLLLVDTPDMDSVEQEKHIPIIHNAIELSDVLICVFNSENPKRKDYVDFLLPYIQRFSGESLVCVMNKCDRQDENELKSVILPEFMEYIQNAWDRRILRVLCTNARNHLNDPQWDLKAAPRHPFDQFDELRTLIFDTYNRSGYAVDRRLENAQRLRDFIFSEVAAEIEKDRENLIAILKSLQEAERLALKNSFNALSRDNLKQATGVNVLVYQKLAQNWLGPVGWLIALWARILIFGTGMMSMFRFGNPIRQVAGIASSIWHFKESKAAVAETENSERIHTAIRDYQITLMKHWPDIAESLIEARFDDSLRNMDENLPDMTALTEELDALWTDTLDSTIESATRKLSHGLIQFLFNIPIIIILVYIGWITGVNFFSGHYLTSDFFLHAFLTLAIVLFLCFFLFQGIARIVAGADKITGEAFDKIRTQAEQIHQMPMIPVVGEVKKLVNMRLNVE